MNRRTPEFSLSTKFSLGLLAIAIAASACARPRSSEAVPTAPYLPTGTPSGTPVEVTRLPTQTLTETPNLTSTITETLAPIQTSTATLTPFPTATPGLRVCQVSAYEACDNEIGINAGGAAQAVFTRLIDHLTSAWEQLARYGNFASRQDYAADMLFSPVEDELTAQRGPDFWERHGGLGFNPDNYNGHDGVQVVLNADPKNFFQLGSDKIYRAIVEIQEEEAFEFGLAAAARAKFQILYPDLDFTKPEVLRAFDDLIRAEVQNAVRENGFRPKTAQPWPGAEKIFGFESGSFIDGEGEVCIGERPAGDGETRSSQGPEQLPKNWYERGLEDLSGGNNETPNRLDTRGSVMAAFAFDSNRRYLRTDIFSLSSPPDPLRVEAEPLDLEQVDERVEIGRWVPCGPAAPAPEITVTWTATGPVLQVTSVDTPRPGATPAPTETPRPTGAPTQPPTGTPRLGDTPTPPVATTEVPRSTDAPTQPPQATATAGNPVETPNPPTPEPTSAPAETQTGPEPTTIPVDKTSTPSR